MHVGSAITNALQNWFQELSAMRSSELPSNYPCPAQEPLPTSTVNSCFLSYESTHMLALPRQVTTLAVVTTTSSSCLTLQSPRLGVVPDQCMTQRRHSTHRGFASHKKLPTQNTKVPTVPSTSKDGLPQSNSMHGQKECCSRWLIATG